MRGVEGDLFDQSCGSSNVRADAGNERVLDDSEISRLNLKKNGFSA